MSWLAGAGRPGHPAPASRGGPRSFQGPARPRGHGSFWELKALVPPRDTQQPVPVRECVLSPSTAGLSTAGPSPGPCRVPGRQTTARVHPHPPALPQDHAMTSQPGGHWTAIAATTHSCREGEAFLTHKKRNSHKASLQPYNKNTQHTAATPYLKSPHTQGRADVDKTPTMHTARAG